MLRPLHLVYTFIALLGLIEPSALAQDKNLARGEMPLMALRVCGSAEAAERQSLLSRGLGSRPLDRAKLTTERDESCRMILVHAKPISVEPIPAYLTWMVTYDKSSPVTHKANIDGQSHDVNYSMRLQESKFYYASLRDHNNKTFEAWVEIPQQPYLAAYLEEKKRVQLSSWSPDGVISGSGASAIPASYKIPPTGNVQKSN